MKQTMNSLAEKSVRDRSSAESSFGDEDEDSLAQTMYGKRMKG